MCAGCHGYSSGKLLKLLISLFSEQSQQEISVPLCFYPWYDFQSLWPHGGTISGWTKWSNHSQREFFCREFTPMSFPSMELGDNGFASKDNGFVSWLCQYLLLSLHEWFNPYWREAHFLMPTGSRGQFDPTYIMAHSASCVRATNFIFDVHVPSDSPDTERYNFLKRGHSPGHMTLNFSGVSCQ